MTPSMAPSRKSMAPLPEQAEPTSPNATNCQESRAASSIDRERGPRYRAATEYANALAWMPVMSQTPIPYNKPFIAGKELFYIAQAVTYGNIAGDGHFTQRCRELL